MGPFLLLSVMLHCFCQSAVGQQEEPDPQGQEQVEQVEPVRESEYYLASVNSSQKSGDSEQTWKKLKVKHGSICTGLLLLLDLELCVFSTVCSYIYIHMCIHTCIRQRKVCMIQCFLVTNNWTRLFQELVLKR